MSESEVPMIEVAQDHFNAVMDENKLLKKKNATMAKALYEWLVYMDKQGYTDKQYKKGDLRESLQKDVA